MKKKMIEYLQVHHWSNGRDNEIIQSFISEFFDFYQPERSKREDGINTLRCGNCEKEYDIFLDPNHPYRCGALNSMET